jgi:molecular chaperone DnaK
VAVGAAIQGAVLKGEVTGLLLVDVTPLSLGIETMGDVFSRIIDRNTTLPVQRSQVFTTAANFQTTVEIHVLQGERQAASQNKTLGKFRLTGIRRALQGIPQIEVTFSIDTNGIVHVAAKDLGTGKHQEITLFGSTNMSSEEIDRAIRDAEKYAVEDARRKETAELTNRAEQMVYEARSAAKRMKGQDRDKIIALADRVKKALDTKDMMELKDAAGELAQALNMAGRGGDMPPDGAMDADYTTEKDKDGDQPK